MNNESALILGARSDIALAIAHRLAAKGYAIQLAARDISDMDTVKSDLELRYRVQVSLFDFDALATDMHAQFIDQLPELPAIAVCAVGALGNQLEDEINIPDAIKIIRSNFEGPMSILSHLANRFEKRGSGVLVGISSVAGNRGRASNYIYGSSKAGFTAFLSGLRNRLANAGVHVVTVLPGFVATKMTEGLDLPSKLTAQPDEVAKTVLGAIERKRNVIYVRSIWRFIMLIIVSIPEVIFKKLHI